MLISLWFSITTLQKLHSTFIHHKLMDILKDDGVAQKALALKMTPVKPGVLQIGLPEGMPTYRSSSSCFINTFQNNEFFQEVQFSNCITSFITKKRIWSYQSITYKIIQGYIFFRKGWFLSSALGSLIPKIELQRLLGVVHKHLYSHLNVGMYLLDHFVHYQMIKPLRFSWFSEIIFWRVIIILVPGD